MQQKIAQSPLFSEQQAKLLTTGVRPHPWDDSSLHEALRHRVQLSRHQYDWLRSNGYPLPGLATLQRYLAGFVLRPDDPSAQLELLAKMVVNMSSLERQCVLMYDEMDIMNVATYDQQLDQVLGPHRHLQQYMVTGVFSSWKLPVLFQFDTAATSSTIISIIKDIEAIGLPVVATVSDMGGSNVSVWSSLDIKFDERTWFVNPANSERRIWVFADLPHVAKRLRNNLLDHGLKTKGGGRLDKALMTEMVAINGSAAEYRVAHRVHLETHIQVNNMARQKVRPAMELVSASVALAIERHLGRPEEVRALRVFDAGMDVLNAIHPHDAKPLRRGYRGTPDQEAALTALETEAKTMRVGQRGERNALMTFQKGVILCVASARGLLHDMREKFGDTTFLLTRRLTQDRLEGFFGLVRGRGGSNINPTPTEVRSRLRLLTLLFAIQRGVKQLRSSNLPATTTETDEGEDAASEEQVQVEVLEEECVAGLDSEVAVELQAVMSSPDQSAAETQVEDEELAELEELLDSVPDATDGGARAASAGACDVETGVPASDSAMAYVAGYVSRKRPSDPSPDTEPLEEPLEVLWTRLRSHGGLTVPTAAFMDTFRRMETTFCAHHALHPDGLSRRPGVIRELLAVLEAKFGAEVTPRVRRTFARVRTFIRLRHLNAMRRSAARSNSRRETRKRRQYVLS